MRKTFATRLLSRGAAITDVQHLLGHASVKTTERSYAANKRTQSTQKVFAEMTDANIDASCNRTHHGSNWVVYVGKSTLILYN